MNKPDSLRKHLLETVPGLANNPDCLLMFIDEGKVRSIATAALSFEYGYNLQIILTDYAGHPDSVFLPLLAWIRVNQSELMENHSKSADGVKFEADILDNSKVDFSIELALTERVIVKNVDGVQTVTHAGEPQRNPNWPGEGPEWIVPNV
ncbi:phage tail protein [Pseudomonas sp. A2]|uniref:phage tail protein n=1 Tax=Pseudomonas sp. A2 TaxID=107445 RepID=UPI002B565D7F|nr:phage tail protein [Pseudomonas sp. A2]MEB3437909.1 phage tail protein [Pseudomonas sp. A2]